MSKQEINFEQDANEAPTSPESFKALHRLISHRKQLSEQRQELESQLKAINLETNRIDRETLPEAMKTCSVNEVTTEDGLKVSLKDIVQGSIPSITAIMRAKGEERDELISRREEAFQYLEGHGAAAIIKSSVKVELAKGDDQAALAALSALRDLGLDPKKDDSVHAGQLNSWLKERISSGAEVDYEVLSVYTGEQAVIKSGRKTIK